MTSLKRAKNMVEKQNDGSRGFKNFRKEQTYMKQRTVLGKWLLL